MREANPKPSTMRIKEICRNAGGIMLDLIFPPVCPFCKRPWHRSYRKEITDLIRAVRGKAGERDRKPESGICPQCRMAVPVVPEPFCLKCGKPIDDETQEYCYDCSRRHHVFDEGRALYPHTGVMKQAVYELKYADERLFGTVFGREMALRFGAWIQARGVTLIVPVPLHKRRLKERGYNQAALVAKALAHAADLPYSDRVLRRTAETKRLKTLDPVERRLALEDAFESDVVRGNVLVIDDIYTTGSTIDAAAKCLKHAGAEHVYFLTVTIGLGG